MHWLVQYESSHTRPMPLPWQVVEHCFFCCAVQNEEGQLLVDDSWWGSTGGAGEQSAGAPPGGTLPQMHWLVQFEYSHTRPMPLPWQVVEHCCFWLALQNEEGQLP